MSVFLSGDSSSLLGDMENGQTEVSTLERPANSSEQPIYTVDNPITTLERPKSMLERQNKFTDSVATLESGFSDDDVDCVGKTKKILKNTYKIARSLFGLILIFLLYSILGALVFMAIESRHEQHYKTNIREERAFMIEQLLAQSTVVTPTPLINTTIEQWMETMETLLLKYEDTVRDAVQNDVNSNSTEEVWTIWSSLFFVFTVYTTIGKSVLIMTMVKFFEFSA